MNKTPWPVRWGHLRLIKEWRDDVTRTDETGKVFYREFGIGPKRITLQCDCGHAFTILKTDFPGKRIAQSCNRPECPYTKPEKPAKATAPPATGRQLSPYRKAYSVYLPETLADEVTKFATANTMSFSAAVAHIIQEHLIDKLLNTD
jgi:hypothetical protein